MKKLEKKIIKILEKGTKIVSFNYFGVVYNVLIGANAVAGPGKGYSIMERGFRYFNGDTFLLGIVNEGSDLRRIKSFNLRFIDNFSIV